MNSTAGDSPARSKQLRRLPVKLISPTSLLLMALALHVIGRVAAFCGPFKVDSLVYAVSAYRIWQPDATCHDLVPDKPPGQMLLTGWCYRVLPGEPSRLTLVPIESLFLLSAYLVFWLLARRLFAPAIAAALTLLVVIAFNVYNALDLTTDGFNLNENYVALPMWLAVFAHLTVKKPLRRGLIRGLGLGLALSIKQTTVGLVAAMLLHGMIRYRRVRDHRSMWIAMGTTAACIGLIGAAVLTYLAARGWFADYVPGLADRASRRVGSVQFRWLEDYKLKPIAAFGWWVLLGLLAARWRPASGAVPRDENPGAGLITFAGLWLLAEALMLWHLQIPSTHYYQQIVVPCALLAGAAFLTLTNRLRRSSTSARVQAMAWITATTAALALMAVIPLLAAASKLAWTFDPAAEVRLFSEFREQVRQSEDINWDRENWR